MSCQKRIWCRTTTFLCIQLKPSDVTFTSRGHNNSFCELIEVCKKNNTLGPWGTCYVMFLCSQPMSDFAPRYNNRMYTITVTLKITRALTRTKHVLITLFFLPGNIYVVVLWPVKHSLLFKTLFLLCNISSAQEGITKLNLLWDPPSMSSYGFQVPTRASK